MGRVRRKAGELDAGELDAGLGAGALDAQRIVQHRDAVKIPGLAEELAAPMDTRLHVVLAKISGLLNAPFKRFIRVTDKFHVDAEVDFSHRFDSLFCDYPDVEPRMNANQR